MAEQYNNLANSTTVGSIDGVTNPITFSVQSGDGALFPATANGFFRVTVCDTNGANAEVMMVTSRATDTFTASRGAGCLLETPTPTLVAHAGGSIVSHDLTVGAFNTVLTQQRPIFTPPVGLTLHDGVGGATLSTDSYGLTLSVPGNNSNSIIYCSTALAHSTYTAIFGFEGLIGAANFQQLGPCVTDGTKFIVWRFPNAGQAADIYYWATFNSFTTQFAVAGLSSFGNEGIFCRIIQDATHRTFYQSDRRMRNWTQIFQQTALTSFTETQAGFFINCDSTSPGILEGFHLTLS
jgi:hypothetical protein